MAIPALQAWPLPPAPVPAPASRRAPPPAATSPAWPSRGTTSPAVPHPALEFVLDRVPDGMIVIDTRAQVLHANRPARELLCRVGDGSAASGALVFKDRPTQRAFERALGRCDAPADDDAEDGGPPAHLFLVRDACGTTVARASVEPLRRLVAGGAGHAGARLVALHRRPDEAEVCADALRALHGLTAAEARIAAAAVASRSIDDLAGRLGLSRNTVKTHLKSVFRKCEVASFGQLAALVATGPRRR